MIPDNTTFEQFFAEKIKEKNISLKKLAEVTGIAPSHIESLIRGDFDNMPSSPYFRGYLQRLGTALEFDGEEWWLKLKKEGVVKNSGEFDTLPKNRFLKKAPPKYLWFVGAGVIILIYLAFQTPRIFGKPSLSVSFPGANPYSTSSSTLTLTGSVSNADSLTLNGDPVTIASDGSWEKGVLLQNGPNTFQILAQKFLGGTTQITEQVIYQGSNNPATSTSDRRLRLPRAPPPAAQLRPLPINKDLILALV
jgi:cytoskeletal protein RodZ